MQKLLIAVIFCGSNETQPLNMMTNQNPPKSLISFLHFMGVPVGRKMPPEIQVLNPNSDNELLKGVYECTWNNTTITWYIAHEMSAEQHRRLIGNCPFVLFFQESTDRPFPLDHVQSLGSMHQCYGTVQLHNSGKYRLGFFHRTTITMYLPLVPSKFLFDPIYVKDFLLVKVYNAYMTCQSCPPFNKMYEEPRADSIKEFIEKHAKKL